MQYRRRAAEAALALISAIESETFPVPIGIAVNSGLAYVGNVGRGHVVDFTVLGDTVNTAARLASCAGAGEVLLSEAIDEAIAERSAGFEVRTLTLRGKQAPVIVRVARASTVAVLQD